MKDANAWPTQIFVTGYYGQRNTGDDALAATISWGIYRFLHPRRICICSSRLVMPDGLPVFFLPRRLFKGHLRLSRALQLIKSQLWCFGGGSIFHDTLGVHLLKGVRNTIRRYKRFRRRNRVIALGVSLGPVVTTASQTLLADILEQLDFVAVRDLASLELASSLGAAEKCVLGFDPAVLLPDVGLPSVSLSKRTRDRPSVSVAPCEYHRVVNDGLERLDDKRNKALAIALLELSRFTDVSFKIFEFNGHEKIGDGRVVDEIARTLPSDRTIVVPYFPNPLVAFEHIRTSACMVATRLHAAIFAFTAGVPIVVLCYHPKVKEFARYVGLAEQYVIDEDRADPEQIITAVSSVLNDPDKALPRMPLEVAKRRALDMFIKASSLYLSASPS